MSPRDDDIITADRDRLLGAALAHVPFDGWTAAALEAGARDAGFAPEDAADLFPGGIADAISWFSRWADRRMLAALEGRDLSNMPVRERIASAVEARLEALDSHCEAVRRGLSWLALPQNAPLAAKLLYRTVDDAWYAAGDRSADFSFYTKRGLLAGVIATTTLYWLDDRSEDGSDTRAFLARRIEDVLRVGSFARRAGGLCGKAPNPFRAFRDAVRRRYDFGNSRFT